MKINNKIFSLLLNKCNTQLMFKKITQLSKKEAPCRSEKSEKRQNTGDSSRKNWKKEN